MCSRLACSRRNVLSGVGALFGSLIVPRSASAQRHLVLQGKECNMFGNLLPGEMPLLEASPAARGIVEEICDVIAIPQNFTILATNNPPNTKAFATMEGFQRVIVYGEDFMTRITNKRTRDWAGFTVMAHEVGHHLIGHPLDGLGSQPPRELQADKFAGRVIRLLGGELEDAKSVFRDASEEGSETHPARNDRIVQVTAGWHLAAAGQRAEERYELVTHNEVSSQLVRVLSVFVGRDKIWEERQQDRVAARFREVGREAQSIILYDESRSIWLKLDVNARGRWATGSWAQGPVSILPSTWTPLDPSKWGRG